MTSLWHQSVSQTSPKASSKSSSTPIFIVSASEMCRCGRWLFSSLQSVGEFLQANQGPVPANVKVQGLSAPPAYHWGGISCNLVPFKSFPIGSTPSRMFIKITQERQPPALAEQSAIFEQACLGKRILLGSRQFLEEYCARSGR